MGSTRFDPASPYLPRAGTPGIGKTAFGFVLLHWLVKEGVATTIVVQSQEERFLFSAQRSEVREGSLLDFEVELREPRTW